MTLVSRITVSHCFLVYSLEKTMVGPRQVVKSEGVVRMSLGPITVGLWGRRMGKIEVTG